MTAPLITVVVPTYQDPTPAAEALASVVAQDIDDWEVVIVDDGSSPRDQAALRAIVETFADPRLRVVCSLYNRGPARARNLGVRLAKGRYLAFLDADDLWRPEKLRIQLGAMRQTGVGLSCTAYENQSVETGTCVVRVPPAKITYDQLLWQNTMGCSTVMFDRARIGRSYFPDIRMRQDFAHWLQILRPGGYALGLPDTLTTRRQFTGSLSSNKARAAWYTWRMYRDIQCFGVPRAARCFGAYAWRGFFTS